MRYGWCVFTLLATVWSQASDEVFELNPVVDGVYAAIAKPSYKVNCNAAVILLDNFRSPGIDPADKGDH